MPSPWHTLLRLIAGGLGVGGRHQWTCPCACDSLASNLGSTLVHCGGPHSLPNGAEPCIVLSFIPLPGPNSTKTVGVHVAYAELCDPFTCGSFDTQRLRALLGLLALARVSATLSRKATSSFCERRKKLSTASWLNCKPRSRYIHIEASLSMPMSLAKNLAR